MRARRKILLGIVILLLLAVLAGLIFFKVYAREIARRHIERVTQFHASIGKMEMEGLGHVRLHDVELTRPDGSQATLIQSALIDVSAAGRIKSVTIDGGTASFRLEDFQAAEQKPPVKPPDFPIHIRNGRIELALSSVGTAPAAVILADVAIDAAPRAGIFVIRASAVNPVLGRVKLDARIAGNSGENQFNLSIPKIALQTDAFASLPPSVRDVLNRVWQQYGLEGRASINVAAGWEGPPPKSLSAAHLRWTVAVDGGSFCCPNLPDRVTAVAATVEGDDASCRIVSASAQYRGADIRLTGQVALAGDGIRSTLRASVRNLKPSDALWDALPPGPQRVIKKINIRDGIGQVDADAETTLLWPIDLTILSFIDTDNFGNACSLMTSSSAVLPDWAADRICPKLEVESISCDVQFRKLGVQPKWFPYPLSDVVGGFSIRDHDLIFTQPVIGHHADGIVQMTGHLGLLHSASEAEFQIRGDNLPVDPALIAATRSISTHVAHVVDQIDISGGRVDPVFRWDGPTNEEEEHLVKWSLRLDLNGPRVAYKPFNYSLTGLTGRVDVDAAKIAVQNLIGWHGPATVSVNGEIDMTHKPVQPRFQVTATNLPLDADLANALEPEWRETWNKCQPSGSMALYAVVTPTVREGKQLDVDVTADLNGVSIRAPLADRWLPLTNLRGRVKRYGDVFEFTNLTGQSFGGTLTASGQFIRAEDLTKITAAVKGDNLSLPRALELLPPESLKQVQPLSLQGRFDVSSMNIDLILPKDAQPNVRFQGMLNLRDVSMSIPLSSEDSGARLNVSEVEGRLSIDNSRFQQLHGQLELTRARLLKGTMTNISATLVKTGPLLMLDDLRGDLYGGQLEAWFRGATDLSFFTAQAKISGVDVARLARETDLGTAQVWGNLRAGLTVHGERVDKPSGQSRWNIGGSGSIHVDRANLGETPLLSNVLSYRELLLGEKPLVESADADLQLTSNRIIVDRLVLAGPTASASAVGSIQYTGDKRIDMFFYREKSSNLLPNIPLIDLAGKTLGWVIDRIQNQLVVVHLGGTIHTPTVDLVPLKSISDQILQRNIILNIWEKEHSSAEE